LNFITKTRERYPKSNIFAGNVTCYEYTQKVINAGADVVKILIGSGSACLTRRQTGCGRPAVSSILECKKAADELNAYVMADGGITCTGDICKAFGCGADFVMIGGLFAGTAEAAGEIIEKTDNRFYKIYYGMSSHYAQEKIYGGVLDYRASEGRYMEIPYVGNLSKVLKSIEGGLRSAMTYVGAKDLECFESNVQFIIVRHQLNTVFEKYDKVL
jgi:GMP reductase